MNSIIRQDAIVLKQVARLLKTVGHTSRLMIIDLLLDQGPMPVKDIHVAIDVSQSNASQHLKALEELGILHSQRKGKTILYGIANPQIEQLIRCVNDCTTC